MACEPPSLRPTYLPWAEGAGGIGEPVEERVGTADSPDASMTWAADPDAYRRDDPDGDLSHASVAVLHEYEGAGEDFPRVEVQGHVAELVWVGDPGIGSLRLRWREAPGPCGAFGVWLLIWGSPSYLEGVPDQDASDPSQEDERDRLMGRYDEAVEREIVRIANSLEEPAGQDRQ